MRRLVSLASVAAALLVPAAASAAPPLPSSMAALGESITRATDVCCTYGDHPAQSWSTGDGFDGISSHYERLLALNASIAGHAYNDGWRGAKMRDAVAQAQLAVSQGAQYVTIMLGSNDVCAGSAAGMTSVSDFEQQFISAMNVLAAGLPPGSHVFVSSIPNVYRLWQVLHQNPIAELVWGVAHLCQSMMSPTNSDVDRFNVLLREFSYNVVLANVCAQYAFCRFDGGAVFGRQFTAADVTQLDYFHPSLTGQAALAEVTWRHSWWGG